MEQNTYKDRLALAVKAALLAGKEILEIYNREDFNVQLKEDKSPLTYADRKAHNTIMQFLEDSNIPVLSEEGKHTLYEVRKKWENFWLIDPLDGTKEFIKRNGEFTINIALVHNNIPTLGVIYIPVLKELYIGYTAEGAYKITDVDHDQLDQLTGNNNQIDIDALIAQGRQLPCEDKEGEFVVVGSRSHLSEETQQLIDALKQWYTDINIVSRGSSLKLCMVAEGKADIYPRFSPTMEWDTAAGHAIALASGCEVKQKDGRNDLEYNKENLTNPWFIVKPQNLDIADLLDQ